MNYADLDMKKAAATSSVPGWLAAWCPVSRGEMFRIGWGLLWKWLRGYDSVRLELWTDKVRINGASETERGSDT